jgi:Calcineurin-like phosphoesterase
MNRREFVRSVVGAGAFAGELSLFPAFADAALTPRYATLADAWAATKFDPRDAESFSVVWAADVHYGIGAGENILPPLLREVNALDPSPAFFGIAGDLILRASLSFGQVPGEKQKQEAIAEFKAFQQHLRSLDSRIPAYLALGNHDTYPGEGEPALFRTVFPDLPAYQVVTIKGVPFIFLNGGSCGLLDPAQRAWFREQVRKHHRPGSTLVIVLHQPSLGRVVRERGIPAAVREALADCRGDLWMVSGHEHRNEDACFRLPQAVITQATITAGNPATWGTELPGYWIYGFAKGKLAARVFRRLGQGYAVAPPPPTDQARPILLPFENRPDILWKVLVGEGDEPYRVETQAAWCLNYWYNAKRLVYRFPLAPAGGKAKRCCILDEPSGKEPPKYFLSSDGKAWEEVGRVERTGSETSFPIPAACLASRSLTVRLEGCAVSGFALTTA